MALIEQQADVMGGEPHVKGRRISVRQIVQMVRGDYSAEDIAEEFQMDIDKVNAALQYYRFNREEIEGHMEDELELVEELVDNSEAPVT